MTTKEVKKAIRNLYKEAGLSAIKNDIKKIEKEILKDSPPVLDTRKTFNQTVTSIEAEIHMAKFYGLQELLKDKQRKLGLDLHIPKDFIDEIIKDESIEYPETVKALVITYLEIQNGANRTKALKRLKSTLSIIIEARQNKTKRETEEAVKAISFAYFEDQADSFKNRAKKPSKPIYTDYGYLFNLQ